VFAFEHDANGSIDSFGTATWWAFVTITSVGYGDTVPVTAEGRIVAVFLMILGISLFGFITANIAAYMVEHQGRTSLDDVMTKLEGVERELTELRKELADRDGV
jgi:voltage-gated potassium channel